MLTNSAPELIKERRRGSARAWDGPRPCQRLRPRFDLVGNSSKHQLSRLSFGFGIVTIISAFVTSNYIAYSIRVTTDKYMHHFAAPINTTEFLNVGQIMRHPPSIKFHPAHQLTPGSGPRRTPRRGAAGPDASSPGSSRLPRVRVQSPHTPPAQAVEDTPDAGANAGRPARVCAAEHARRAPRFAPRPDRPAHYSTTLFESRTYIITPKPMSPHFNLLKCRRLGTCPPRKCRMHWYGRPAPTGRRGVRRAARLPRGRRGLPGHRGNNYSGEPMLRGPSSIGRRPRRGPGEKRGHRLTDACVAEPCLRPRQPPLRSPVPHPPPSACADARAREWPGEHRVKMNRSKKEEGRRWVIGKRREVKDAAR
ncbi:hypothetical protein EVAR_56246_1 [Eumeta japonica]|uniref:Uncharacterized protein n=1 Tax=Eumeta variegata TaxID=151549 RepID=A0A4C1XH29_EUMVA|nr:hypothetical protein EVAR_56246_1 [Eumeta japonica]